MCFEKQHVTWLLETHVAFRGGVYGGAAGIFVITGSHLPPPLPREPVTTQAATNRPGC